MVQSVILVHLLISLDGSFQVEGNIFMVYNMGTNDHPIGEINVKVNDNQYHVVRFTRSGANSTIQVDDYNVQTNHPAGNL